MQVISGLVIHGVGSMFGSLEEKSEAKSTGSQATGDGFAALFRDHVFLQGPLWNPHWQINVEFWRFCCRAVCQCGSRVCQSHCRFVRVSNMVSW